MDAIPSDEIASAIRARHVLTGMAEAVTFTPEDQQRRAASILRSLNFDFAPVVVEESVVGSVSKRALDPNADEPVARCLRPLDSRALVSAESSLADLMAWLVQRPFLFVVDGNDVIGFVTPSDMNKQSGRAYFYLLIAGLEMALAEIIRTHFDNQEVATGLLSTGAQERIRGRISQEHHTDVAADMVAAMDLTDLLKIVRSTDRLHISLGYSEKRVWTRELMNPVISLRNPTMHPARPLVGDKVSSLARLVELDQAMRRLVHKANAFLAGR